ncbi:MAG: MFS transporter [Alphaproteobacteria bacterium]|nr:MFS transporter [Alphaproteobacteria bacterium]
MSEATAARGFSLVAAIGATAFSAAAFGVQMPLVSLTLDDWGLTAAEIGVFTLAATASTLVMTPLVPMMLAQVSVRLAMGGACAAMAACFALFDALRSIEAWFVLRLFMGLALTVIFIAGEAWILERKPARGGGFVLGVYASTLAGAIALGGFVVAWLGHAGAPVIWAGAGLAFIALLPLALPGPGLTAPDAESARPAALLRRIGAAPIIMLAPLAMGAIETAAYTLLPVYARRIGFDDQIAAYTIAACGLGNLLLQPAIGWAADRVGARATLLACALAGAVLPATIAFAGGAASTFLALIFVYSGLVTGLYTIGLLSLSARFSGRELASANAAYALAYGIGGVIGPAAAGAAFSGAGPVGFMAALAAMAGGYLLVAAIAPRPRAAD